jgi:hypothetical protein
VGGVYGLLLVNYNIVIEVYEYKYLFFKYKLAKKKIICLNVEAVIIW